MRRSALIGICFGLLVSCTPPKPEIPSLTPQTAASLLQFNARAKVWLIHIQKEDPTCQYNLDLPAQINHPTTVDVDHAVTCGGKTAPRALDAAVSFEFDAASGRWVVKRFSS